MAFLTFSEVLDLIVMTVAIGYISSKVFGRRPAEDYDPLKYYQKSGFLEDLKHGAIIAAPAIILHELAHKFTAMMFGAQATVQAPSLMGIPYGWYILVIILIHLNFPLIFFVGGVVQHTYLPAIPSAVVSISGPLTNLLIWLICISAVKYKWAKRKHYDALGMVAKLNIFLFVFNILPIPGFDGWNFLSALFNVFF